MRMKIEVAGVVGLVMALVGAFDIRHADLVTQVPYSAWLTLALGLLLMGGFAIRTQ